MLKVNIQRIIDEMNEYAPYTKEQLFTMFVSQKLEANATFYLKEIEREIANYNHMVHTDFDLKFMDQDKAKSRVLKRLNRINAKEEKEIAKDNENSSDEQGD